MHASRFVVIDEQQLYLDSCCSRLTFAFVVQSQYFTQRSLFVAESSRRCSRPCIMWNDEDNNPYGTSFERRDSSASSTANVLPPDARKFRNIIASTGFKDDALYLPR